MTFGLLPAAGWAEHSHGGRRVVQPEEPGAAANPVPDIIGDAVAQVAGSGPVDQKL